MTTFVSNKHDLIKKPHLHFTTVIHSSKLDSNKLTNHFFINLLYTICRQNNAYNLPVKNKSYSFCNC